MLITIITPSHTEKTQYLAECANSIDKARSLLKKKLLMLSGVCLLMVRSLLD